MRFLYVEAFSARNRVLERLCVLSSSPRELDKHLTNLARARSTFKRATKFEAKQFRCERISRVLEDLDAASHQVLRAWRQ